MDYDKIIDEIRNLHEGHSELSEFCAFPNDVSPQAVTPRYMGAKDYFQKETGLFGSKYSSAHALLNALAPHAYWRDTYAGTNVSVDFMDKFGCFSLIGKNGFFHSDQMNAWMVYMPAGLYYPWHQHPAEEMYLCLSGEAVFKKRGCSDQILGQGETTQHATNQPHAMETHDHPVLCYVFWRNEFLTAPVLTHTDAS